MTLSALRRGDLAGARSLKLNEGLTEFPDEIFGLADTLEMLDLSGNHLTTLPADLGRLHRLRIFFGSGNQFRILPPPLGACPNLSQIGCRKAGLSAIPAEALPPALRWLTVTDNTIADLPDAIGAHPRLQKLLLSGNRLSRLPHSLEAASNLELLRISANRFAVWPGWITDLPRLAWLALAGNPYDAPRLPARHRQIPWSALTPDSVLGEGASGIVHRMLWQATDGAGSQPVAVKLFKGRMTSDGAAMDEMAAMLAIGHHANLTAPLGAVACHPQGMDGLVMPLLPGGWRPLAAPPSFASCSRDVYDPALTFTRETAQHLATGIAQATRHLHARGLIHGDLYAHNVLWDGEGGDAVLSDFGAAGFYPPGTDHAALQRIDIRAWGILAAEIAARCPDGFPELQALADECQQLNAPGRPLMDAVCAQLARL